MASNFTWGGIGNLVSLLTTELDALASLAGSAYGPEINNVLGPQRGELRLHLASNSLAFTTASFVSIYLVSSTTPNAAGGAYPTYTSGTTPIYSGNGLVGNINVNPQTQSANVVDETQGGIIVPAGYFKTILINKLGVNMPATLNTLGLYTTPTQY